MVERIDLHIHSHFSSDGDVSPRLLVEMAREKGLRAISIADHDTVAAYPEALAVGEELGVEIIPGMELTTLYEEREYHLLLPFVDWKSETVAALEADVRERRMQEARERVALLNQIGIDIGWDEVLVESNPFPPLGVTIAQAVLKKAERAGWADLAKYNEGDQRGTAPYRFYRDFFSKGRPAAAPRRNISLLDVLDRAKETGGVPVLAHPGAPFQRAGRAEITALKQRGLQGLEVFTSYHDGKQMAEYRAIAEDLDLVPTVGSDFHGSIKPHIPFGSVEAGGYWMVERLRLRRET